MSLQRSPRGPRVQFIAGDSWVTQVDYVPVVGQRCFHAGDMYDIVRVEDLGRGRMRVHVKLDPSWRAALPQQSCGAPPDFNKPSR